MALSTLIILIILFFFTSVVGVVTGGNSLITVPVMFQFGIDEKVAVATNMFGLTFMAVGATIPFLRQGKIEFGRTSPLVVLTIVGSAIGAALVGFISNQAIRLIVSVAMIAVALFILFKRDSTGAPHSLPARNAETVHHIDRDVTTIRGFFTQKTLAYFLTFFLGIYGGLYSGGYVTILTAVFVAFLGMTFTEAVASTKFVNVFSSSIATVVFMWQGLVDYKLGIILGVTMFIGAYAGAHFAAKMNDVWLKRIFLTTVFLLAIKILFDFV